MDAGIFIRSSENLGCILGHNLAFDVCAEIAKVRGWQYYDIVMVDTDVEVYHHGWLSEVEDFAVKHTSPHPVGIVGLEHSSDEVCAGAVALDTSGNWYLHKDQTSTKTPVRAESVGLGMAVLFWPVPTLRFDEGFKLYYKQDDDLCFQVRANLGLDVWAYPIDMVHWGSGGLRLNEYDVSEEARGRKPFEEVKRKNQAYFTRKWRWALAGRRANLQAEQKHLEEMDKLMLERRLDSGLTQ